MNEQETKKNTSKNKKPAEAQAPRPSEENVENASNNEKYVLYADIMGFKERVMRTKHEDLKKELKELRERLEDWFKPFVYYNEKTFKVSFFSDSILIVEENTKKGFNRISKVAAGLMQVSLECKFPIKGAIAKGEFIYEEDDQLFFGRAIVDAYLLQQDVHYYGIVAHHTVEEDIKALSNGWENKGEIKKKNPYVLSPVPLKSGKTSHYHLAYNLFSSTRETGKDVKVTNEKIISWLEGIYGTVSGAPRIYVDNTLQVLKEDLRLFEEAPKIEGEVEFPLKAFQ